MFWNQYCKLFLFRRPERLSDHLSKLHVLLPVPRLTLLDLRVPLPVPHRDRAREAYPLPVWDREKN